MNLTSWKWAISQIHLEQVLCYEMVRGWYLFCTRPTCWSACYSAISLRQWNDNCSCTMADYQMRQPVYVSTPNCCVTEATHNNSLVHLFWFDSTGVWTIVSSVIFYTRCEYANHYTDEGRWNSVGLYRLTTNHQRHHLTICY